MKTLRTYKTRWVVSEKVEIYAMPSALIADARKAGGLAAIPENGHR
ncbi:MAG TPA: hypothetical protein VNT26_20970 [Candidatus Sulfotelmatobacter sp.]|nr:hypothetical protein [Candidatus Sulfotelmatobacter sp.]